MPAVAIECRARTVRLGFSWLAVRIVDGTDPPTVARIRLQLARSEQHPAPRAAPPMELLHLDGRASLEPCPEASVTDWIVTRPLTVPHEDDFVSTAEQTLDGRLVMREVRRGPHRETEPQPSWHSFLLL